MLDALPYWTISIELPLLKYESSRLEKAKENLVAVLNKSEKDILEEREHNAKIRLAIENSEAGRRIAEIDTELRRTNEEKEKRRERAGVYAGHLRVLGLNEPQNIENFSHCYDNAEKELVNSEKETEERIQERDELVVSIKAVKEKISEIDEELQSLKKRNTSIPFQQLKLRESLAIALGVEEEELPFAGELMRVHKDYREWEGTAEKVLRSFALSLIVKEGLYRKVSSWVRGRDLDNRRLVYFRAPEKPESAGRPDENSLAGVIEIKDSSPFRQWLESELGRRADFKRVESMEDFYRETDAVTKEGLIKSGRIRHEKDDRKSVSDPRNYVLGWSNLEKISLLEKDISEKRKELSAYNEKLKAVEYLISALSRKRMQRLLSDLSRDLTRLTGCRWQGVMKS